MCTDFIPEIKAGDTLSSRHVRIVCPRLKIVVGDQVCSRRMCILRYGECVDWMLLAQDTGEGRDFVAMVMNFPVPLKLWNCRLRV